MKKARIVVLLQSANSLVAEMTSYKVSKRKSRSAKAIAKEYIDNTFAVNQMLLQRGIMPIL